MTKQEIIDFISENPVCALATCEGDQPRVRSMMTFRADDQGLLFITGTQKDMNRQLLANPKVELCYFVPPKGLQLRVTGSFVRVEDDGLKAEVFEKFAFLKPMAEQYGYGAFTLWRLPRGAATLWNQERAMEPLEKMEF